MNAAARRVLEACSAQLGPEVAASIEAEVLEEQAKARATLERQAEAEAISKARVRRGERAEEPPGPLPRKRGRRRREDSKAKQAMRERRKLGDVFKRRAARDNVRQQAQAEAMSAKAFEQHGIRHHYRELPKVAWFAGHYAALDRNGVLVLQMLEQVNMPKARRLQVLEAMRVPKPYQPRRDVCTGERASQKRFEPREGQQFKGRDWTDGERSEAALQSIRVGACAIFLWLSKGRSRRGGYSYKVRGFGRGVFASMLGCSVETLFGHARGLPGAMLALKQAGFIEYGQPPAQMVSPYDRGPSGHAYNVFWFKSDAGERAIEELHAKLAEQKQLPALQRVEESLQRVARGIAHGPSPPAVDIDPADIPF